MPVKKKEAKLDLYNCTGTGWLQKNKIRMYTAIKAYRGQDSITKYATHVRQLTIPKKIPR